MQFWYFVGIDKPNGMLVSERRPNIYPATTEGIGMFYILVAPDTGETELALTYPSWGPAIRGRRIKHNVEISHD